MEDNLKRIVSETTRVLREQGKTVDPRVIAYMACLQDTLNSWDEISGGASIADSPMEPAKIAALSKFLVGVMSDMDTPFARTATMQIMMEAAFKQQRKVVEAEQADREEDIGMLERSVTGPKPLKDTSMESYEKFYKRVFEFVARKSGMDRAMSEVAAADEVRAAMESVFPLSTLARFLTLPESERLDQVEELARITLGICLYNRAIGRGGYALSEAPSAYLPQAQRLERDIDRHIQSTGKNLESLAKLMMTKPEAADAIHAEAVNSAQSLVLFEQMKEDLGAGLAACAQLEGEMQHCLLQVQDSVGSSVAVPKELIYPLFDQLGMMYQALQEEVRLMVVRRRLFDELVGLTGGFASLVVPPKRTMRPSNTETEQPQPVGGGSPPEAGVPDGYEFTPGYGGLGTVPPNMALGGFCPVTFARNGTLARFDPSVGFITSAKDGKLYGFGSLSDMNAFCSDPTTLLGQVDAAAAQQPLVAKLAGLSHKFPALDAAKVVDIMSGPLKVDFGSQTPTHFLEKHIDYSYEWNEWALRRRALQLANLRQKATHSTQTGLSHFKRDGETQVWQPKAAQVQTRVNKGQAMPKKLQYVQGLRGAPDTKMNVIRLELDLGQPHQH